MTSAGFAIVSDDIREQQTRSKRKFWSVRALHGVLLQR